VTELWANHQWLIDSDKVLRDRDHAYRVEPAKLNWTTQRDWAGYLPKRRRYVWPMVVACKPYADLPAFIHAFRRALELNGYAVDHAMLQQTWEDALIYRRARYRASLRGKHGKQPRH